MKYFIKENLYYIFHRFLWLLLLIPSVGFRRVLLNLCGANIAHHVSILLGVKILAPWRLVIKSGTTVNSSVLLDARGGLTIGRNCQVGYGSKIHSMGHSVKSSNFSAIKNGVNIKDNVVIFSESYIGPGTNIGKNVIIYPRTVIFGKHSIEDHSRICGNPYKHLSPSTTNLSDSKFNNSPLGL